MSYEIVELDEPFGEQQWAALLDGEPNAWGDAPDELTWGGGQHRLTALDAAGRTVAHAGLALAEVAVGGGQPFDVGGIGGVFVHRDHRRHGLAHQLTERLLGLAQALGLRRAMLFCLPDRMPLYASLGFAEIDAKVLVAQPAGPLEMPMRAMWRPLSSAGEPWPAGPVEVLGLPF